VITALARRPDSRHAKVLDEIKDLEPAARVARLEQEVAAALKENELALLESVRFSTSGGSVYGPDADLDDDGEVWDELGIRGAMSATSQPQMRTLEDLRRARDVCRELAVENEYAIGAHNTRINYLVGKGLRWRCVPKDAEKEDKALTRRLADLVKKIGKEVLGAEREGETVLRADRDGEAFMRLYPNATGLPRMRFVEPQHVGPPRENQERAPWGVERVNGEVVAYWIQEDSAGETRRVPARWTGLDVREGGPGIPQVVHFKLNTDESCDRGWPTMYPIRRPLARAEKLQRNRSYVTTARAAILLIRTHETATKDQVSSMLERAAAATATNTATGQTTRYIQMREGTIVDAPKGTSYEMPSASARADDGGEVHAADLRAAAVRCGQPEYMFTGDSSGAAYSSQLVAESPFVKQVERGQVQVGCPLYAIVEACLIHEEFMGRLPAGTFEAYDLQCEFPSPIVRDQLQKAQEAQILSSMGAVSRLTVRQQWGYDDVTEERNLDTERARGYLDLRVTAPGANNAGAPPAPGSTAGGPGGLDHDKPADSAPNGRPPGSTDDPAAAGKPAGSGAAPAPGAETVQDTALNGAQVSSMIELVQAVAEKKLPGPAAIEMLLLAFPSVGQERATRIVNAAASFAPKPDPAPAPGPGLTAQRQPPAEPPASA
jgi:hypothetical protein